MPKRRIIIVLLACAMLAAVLYPVLAPVVCALLPGPSQPSYQGKSLSEWVILLDTEEPPTSTAAAEAVRKMGTNALPCLLTWIRTPVPPWTLGLASKAYERAILLPSWLTAVCFRPICAGHALVELGPATNSAVPELTRLANDQSDSTRARIATEALDQLGKTSFPALLVALTNRSEDIRARAVVRMGYQGSNARPVIPLLLQYAGEPATDRVAMEALGRLALEPNLVVPALSNRLHHTQNRVRVEAAYALGGFGNEPALVVPALAVSLSDSELMVRRIAAKELAGFADGALIAAPALVAALKDSDPEVRLRATNALLKIAPGYLTKTPPATNTPTR